MAKQDLQARIAELQARRDLLEGEARAHEQAARDKRAERAEIKNDLAELGVALRGSKMVAAAESSAAAAESARQLADERATHLTKLQVETERLNKELQERIEGMIGPEAEAEPEKE